MKKRYITKLPDGRKKQYAILLGRRKLLTHGKIVEDSLLTKIYRSYFIPENFVEEEEPSNNMNGVVVNGAVGVKGEKGDKGDRGDRGERGLQGERGEKGEKGDRGEKGIKGERGEQGFQGEKGEKGDRGEQGIQGERGERGLKGEKGDKGDPGERGERGEKGEKGDPGERGADAVLPNFKTINGESLIGDGDLSPVTQEVKDEIRRAVNADILPNLETMYEALVKMDAADKQFRNTVLTDVRTWISDLRANVNVLNEKMVKLLTVFPESYLDELVRWTMTEASNWSNVFGGTSIATRDSIRFNNQKSCFLAPENVTGIKFKLRGSNNPGGYILWLITSVNSTDQSDVRAFTMDFQTYMQETYTNWIKPREGHTAYDGHHGATAQNIKDVFNVHNVEISVVDTGDKIVCSNRLGFSFEVPKFTRPNFVTRLGIGSQANFSNNVEAYDIAFYYPQEQSSDPSSSDVSSSDVSSSEQSTS